MASPQSHSTSADKAAFPRQSMLFGFFLLLEKAFDTATEGIYTCVPYQMTGSSTGLARLEPRQTYARIREMLFADDTAVVTCERPLHFPPCPVKSRPTSRDYHDHPHPGVSISC